MEYNNHNEYIRRAQSLKEVILLHPAVMKAVKTEDRQVLELYYLGGLQADNPVEYRSNAIKENA